MADYRVKPPDEFDFKTPAGWLRWKERFERFRLVTKMEEDEELHQINSLVYHMGQEAEDILKTFNLSATQSKDFKIVLEKFDGYFVPKRNVIFERAKFNKRSQGTDETQSESTADHWLAE